MHGLANLFFWNKEREEWEITERKKWPRDLPGFEPGTFRLPGECSSDWATSHGPWWMEFQSDLVNRYFHRRWGWMHLNFVFICRMATRLSLKLRIELFFTVIKSFWGVHVQVLAEIFAQRWGVSLSQRLVTEAIGVQRQPWSNWTFLTKRNLLTTLEWSPTTMAVPFCFHVMVGLKLAGQRARAKQNRAMGSPWRRGWWRWWSGVRHSLGGARRGRDVREIFGDEDDIEDVEDESFEQEGPLEEGLGEAEVEHKVEEEALVAETLLTGTQAVWATKWCSTTHLARCESRRIWTTRISSTERTWCPFPHDIVNLKGNGGYSQNGRNLGGFPHREGPAGQLLQSA